MASRVENLVVSTDVLESTAEGDSDTLSAESEGGSGTIQGGITNTENQHVSL